MDVSELDYELPLELIAQRPAERRDASRLLVYDRGTGDVRQRSFAELADELDGESVVVNDTRVVPARIPIESPARRGAAARATRGRRLGRRSRGRRGGSSAGRRYGPSSCSSTSAKAAGGSGWTASRTARTAAAVHHGAARRPRPLPDRLCPRRRLCGGADGRPPLHARAARAARRGARHAPRRPRHVPAGERGAARGARDPRRAIRGRRRRHGSASRAAGRVLAVGTTTVRVLETLARGAPLAADRALHHARLRVPPRRRAPDELPPAALDAARARDGVRRHRGDARALPARRRASATASTRSAMRC